MKFKTKHLFVVLTVIAIGLAVTQLDLFVADWRQGNGVCPIHNQKMKTVVVHGINGTVNFPPQYYFAKSKEFPNCGIEYPQELYSRKRAKIFVCTKCEKNRRKWITN